jgi:dihydroflavonol-4-reductase
MTSNILITGATGFIGRHLTRNLISEGLGVRVLARNPQKAHSLFAEKVEVSAGDLLDPASLARACAGIEIVYHIGGLYRFGLRHRRAMLETNMAGTENLLRAAAEVKVQKFVHVSSASVFWRAKNALDPCPVLDETDFPSSAPRFSSYKRSKWMAEQRVLAWVKRGLPAVIANPSCPIGSGDETPTPTGRMIQDFSRGRFPCYTRTGLNFVNVSDLGIGLQQVAKQGRVGERYLLTNENMWLKEFLDCLAELTGQAAPRVRLPNGLILAASFFGEGFDLLNARSTSARLCIETAIQANHAQFFSDAKARRELGWSPSAIRSGARQALDWFRAEPVPVQACDPLPVTKSHVR